MSILIFLVYIFSDVFFGIFYGIFRSPYFSSALDQKQPPAGRRGALRGQPAYDIPWIYSFLVLAAIGAAAGFVLKKKVRGVEVIR